MTDEPPCPPLVLLTGGGEDTPAFLLCWELREGARQWLAWVAWIRESGGRPVRHVVSVEARRVQPLEAPEAYRNVPRRIRGMDGVIRPWPSPSS